MNKEDLTTYTKIFIEFGSHEYIPTPQIYSPLYVQLYDALLSKNEPKILGIDSLESLPDSTLEDINNHSTNSFDRFLMACYVSPFELSYPLPICEEDLKYQKLNQYLYLTYNKKSSEYDSFKQERAIKDVLSLFPVRYRDSFWLKDNKKYRSSFFKLLTLNYKLSRVNEKWKDHARRANSSDRHHYHMDTIIAFNGLNSDISRQASATFMTLFYELDQSSPDGDTQESRNIVGIPSALELIDFAVRDYLVEQWCEGFDCEERSQETKLHIEKISKKIREKVEYDDPHHHFCDVLKSAILSNSHHNKLLAKREFEDAIFKNEECRKVFLFLLKSGSWYTKPLEKPELTSLIKESLPDMNEPLSNNVFGERIWSIAKTLKPLLINRIPELTDEAAHNLSVLFVILCKKFFPRVRGSLQGANHRYSLWAALKDGHSKLKSESLNLWQYESVYRPSLLHMMELVSLLVLWKSEKIFNRFEQFVQLRREVLESQIVVGDTLDGEHHLYIIKLANLLTQEKSRTHSSNEPVMERFWKKSDPKIKSLSRQLTEHYKRASLRWPS